MKKAGEIMFKLSVLGFALFATVTLGDAGIVTLDLPFELKK